MASKLGLGEVIINTECVVWWTGSGGHEVELSDEQVADIEAIVGESRSVDLSVDLDLRTWDNSHDNYGDDMSEGTLTGKQVQALLEVVLRGSPGRVKRIYRKD